MTLGGLLELPSLQAAGLASRMPASRLIKVLPHLLDSELRSARAPSLYQRDAYQAYLRQHPEQVSTVRFDVQSKVFRRDASEPRLRLTLRMANRIESDPVVVEAPVKAGVWGRSWQSLQVDPEIYRAGGKVVAWRIEMLKNGAIVDSQSSFLW